MRPCAAAAVSCAGERVFVVAAQAEAVTEAEVDGGDHRGWILDVGPQRWTPVVTPVGFTGFVFSAAAVRI
ncbi:hypothetical protein B296_00027167 [Ensete ventricosum]|uniref:Uncharacterized protein n=1 Tax=Ensete ventricosum TaxID=4639 RepID=A0A426YPM0_ENSVE|nr:hypothetical protein B296_00027167 [Ensete ventricosum]